MLKFDEDKHKYTWNGKVVPSVTQVIGDVLKGERDEYEPTHAMLKGTIVHKMLELYDQGNLGGYDERVKGYLDSWIQFKKTYQVEVKDIEKVHFNDVEMLAGTVDRIAMVGGRLTVIDIKTGKSYKEYPLQTAGYSVLFGNIERRMCVFVSDSGVPEVEEHDNQQDLEVFKSLLKVWKWKKNKL